MYKKIINIIKHYTGYYIKLFNKDSHTVLFHKWKSVRGDETLRLDYPLDDRSVVFDVGGYKGDWAKRIFEKYNCCIYVFEPVPQYYKSLNSRFKDSTHVRIFNFGLFNASCDMHICLDADGTSLYKQGDKREQIRLKDINEFIIENGIERIDLIKINIEGAEYELLNRMLSCGIVPKCADIQIQFHRCVENYTQKYERIRAELLKTHELTYDFPYLWENWRKRAISSWESNNDCC